MLKIYYRIKPFIPKYVRIVLRRFIANRKRKRYKDTWPIMESAYFPPKTWQGWPGNKDFAVILRHDVECLLPMDNIYKIVALEKERNLRSCFNFIPAKYSISREIFEYLKIHGFEIGIHGLNHDGKLFFSKSKFKKRARLINQYLKNWSVNGFAAPFSHHKLNWIHYLHIDYDMSTFDTDPFEPQADGIGTIFPVLIKSGKNNSSFVELPYTLPQDYTLFIILKEKDNSIWKKKLDWIAEKGGMVLVNTHPNYIYFQNQKRKIDQYPVAYYTEFLDYLISHYKDRYWNVLPSQMAKFWKKNNATSF